jgi:hypothetical protein
MSKSGIHIKPENRGKFTASAKKAGMGVQTFASKVLANKGGYSSTQVKRANFARNAAKWKHEDGGTMMGSGKNTRWKEMVNSAKLRTKKKKYEEGGEIEAFDMDPDKRRPKRRIQRSGGPKFRNDFGSGMKAGCGTYN